MGLCDWTPAVIVELVKAVAWPLVILLIGMRFKGDIKSVFKGLFKGSTVTELSASASGITAKFEALKQASEASDSRAPNVSALPESMSLEAIKARQATQETEFSRELETALRRHLSALQIGDDEKLDLLYKELAQFQSITRYLFISRVMFRSQYELFRHLRQRNDGMSERELQEYFESINLKSGGGLAGWDHVKYLAYPASNGVIEVKEGRYHLSAVGRSYVQFMEASPQLVNELSAL